jgi:hypothetical protein
MHAFFTYKEFGGGVTLQWFMRCLNVQAEAASDARLSRLK